MPKIKFTEVISYSSQDSNNPAENLLRPEAYRKWKCAPNASEKQSFVILKFDKLTSINSVDIGNDGSALVELLVSREGKNDYELLLVSSAFMSPAESRNETERTRIRMFGPEKLNKNVAEQKWDRMKIVCTQPFNPRMQYGLSFICAMSPENLEKRESSPKVRESSPKVTRIGSFKLKDDDDSDSITVGSLFAKRNEKITLPMSAAIKDASKEMGSSTSPAGTLKRKDISSSDRTSTPLNKKRITESTSSPKESPSSSHTTNHQNKKNKTEKQTKTDSKHERPQQQQQNPKPKETASKEDRDHKNDIKKKNKKPDSKPSTSSRTDEQQTPKKRKSRPFSSLMEDVVFVMSGYQNPERSTLRDKLTEMGAQYKPDWKTGCTHLICAFTNTPKYRQVKGKGKIVTGKWIHDCHKNKIRYPWRRYGLEKHKNGSESEEEIWAEEILPKVSKPSVKPSTPTKDVYESDAEEEDMNYSDDTDTDDEIQKVLAKQQENKSDDSKARNHKKNNIDSNGEQSTERNIKDVTPKKVKGTLLDKEKENHDAKNGHHLNGFKENSDEDIYGDDTDIDELPDTSYLPLPDLEDFFQGLTFFLYGDMTQEDRKLLTRYIIGYNGQIEDYMSERINIVLTDSKWDEHFDEALENNSSLDFVKTQWIWECCDKKKLVPRQPFLITPTNC